MGFSGWKSRVALVIQSAQVPADTTDFPVLLTKDNIPQESYEADSGYSALNGGGDLRFSSDAAGNTQLACEVGRFLTDNTPANAKVEVWVKIPSISSASNTTFYMFYGKAGQSQPARNDTYGMENVWNSNYKGVWHLNEGWNTTAGGFIESTSNVRHGTGTSAGGVTINTIEDKWGGQCIDATDTNNTTKYFKIACSGSSSYDVRGSTIEAWVRRREPTAGWFFSKGTNSVINWNCRGLGSDGSDDKSWWNTTGGDSSRKSSGTFAQDTWTHLAFAVNSSGDLTFYINGSSSGTLTASIGSNSGTDEIRIGTGAGDSNAAIESWKGAINEVRIHNTARSGNYLLTEYRTMNDPNAFIVEGTPVRLKKAGFLSVFLGI